MAAEAVACSGARDVLVISCKKRATRGQFEFPINIVVCATQSLVAPINIHLSLSSDWMTAALALSCSRLSDAVRPYVRPSRYDNVIGQQSFVPIHAQLAVCNKERSTSPAYAHAHVVFYICLYIVLLEGRTHLYYVYAQ